MCYVKDVKAEAKCAKATNACGTYTEKGKGKTGRIMRKAKGGLRGQGRVMAMKSECDQQVPRLNLK